MRKHGDWSKKGEGKRKWQAGARLQVLISSKGDKVEEDHDENDGCRPQEIVSEKSSAHAHGDGPKDKMGHEEEGRLR